MTPPNGLAVSFNAWSLGYTKGPVPPHDPSRLPLDFNGCLNHQSSSNMACRHLNLGDPSPVFEGVAPNHTKIYRTIYDFFSGKSSTALGVFGPAQGPVIVCRRMFLYPSRRLSFTDGTISYVVAYKISYDTKKLYPD